MKIGMYSSDEIYDELANGFLHHSMVDAMYFEIKKLREKNQQLKKQKDDVVKFLKSIEMNKTDKYIPLRDYKEFGILLRMLGETNE